MTSKDNNDKIYFEDIKNYNKNNELNHYILGAQLRILFRMLKSPQKHQNMYSVSSNGEEITKKFFQLFSDESNFESARNK